MRQIKQTVSLIDEFCLIFLFAFLYVQSLDHLISLKIILCSRLSVHFAQNVTHEIKHPDIQDGRDSKIH